MTIKKIEKQDEKKIEKKNEAENLKVKTTVKAGGSIDPVFVCG